MVSKIGQLTWRKATLDALIRQPQRLGELASADPGELLTSHLTNSSDDLHHQPVSAAVKVVQADAVVRIGEALSPTLQS